MTAFAGCVMASDNDSSQADRAKLLAVLERFETDYNVKDGTDFGRVTMSADAWHTLVGKVKEAVMALDDGARAHEYATLSDEISSQMDATDGSLRLLKSYQAMSSGTAAVGGSSTAEAGDTDSDITLTEAISRFDAAFATYARSADIPIDMAPFLGENLDFSAEQGAPLFTDNNNGIYDIAGWEVSFANADTWAMLQNQHQDYPNQLYMRKNWGSAATTLQVMKQKMLPAGRYKLSFSWNSTTANLSNLSYYKIGDTRKTIGSYTVSAKTLEYEFEVADGAQPFDLSFGFRKKNIGNTPAQMLIDDIVLTYTGTSTPIVDMSADAVCNGCVCYDLKGRRVNGSLKKGVYIRNGRKLIVR